MSHPILDRMVETYDQSTISFDSLRPFHVRDVLLVASLYDSYTLAEDGRLAEQIFGEYQNLSLSSPAHLTRVATAERALELLRDRRFDLVITMARVGDLSVQEFGEKVKRMRPGMPVYLLTYDTRELQVLEGRDTTLRGIDKVFVWRGDVRLFLAVIKLVEDKLNAEHDTRVGHVRVIVLVEDSVPFYSSYLPMLFDEIMKQTSSLIQEGVNSTQKLLRMRARPKILLATTYEEAWESYTNFREVVLGVISDVRFPRRDRIDPEAGVRLLRTIRAQDPYVPMVLQSSDEVHREKADDLNVTFLHKHSPTLLQEFHQFMLENLGFGDFVFRMPDGGEVARASDMLSMVRCLENVPAASLGFHGRLNHFSNWLMARTEFSAASVLRQKNVTDFESLEEMREFLRQTLITFRQRRRRGLVEDFDARRFDGTSQFVRVGGGSLGGKGRGLAFMHELLSRYDVEHSFEDLRIFVPPSAVIGTEVFDRFLESNHLLEFALNESDDDAIARGFRQAHLPQDVVVDLAAFLESVTHPLAVRSSSLLEDSHYQPFAGVYITRMLPNSDRKEVRLQQLLDTVKFIYASTFFQNAKAYIKTTPNRMEEEKMAIVIQKIVGRRVGDYVYPHVSGVAQSYNYYAVPPMKQEEGIANVALGLGKTVVEGGRTVRFSPAHPEALPQLSRTSDILANAQREFFALDVTRPLDTDDAEGNLVRLELAVAEGHDMLWPVASTYLREDDVVHDGISRVGVRLVTFAPLLKGQLVPFAQAVQLLLEMGYRGLSGPVEIEFALNLEPDGGGPKEFGFLQIRPLVMHDRTAHVPIGDVPESLVFVNSPQALGNGRIRGVRDIVAVRRDAFRRESTPEIAVEVGRLNADLLRAERRYLLLGPGRWGSADRWLGIPVSWSQISGAVAILESDLDDVKVEPSQGTHFFQNMTSAGIGYFNALASEGGRIDWEWLESLPAVSESPWLHHVRLEEPLDIRIDGRRGVGVILKRPHESADE